MAIMDFDYNRAIRQANEVDQIADEMMSIADNKLGHAVETLNLSWDGTSADQFLGHCRNTMNDIKSEAKKLKNYASRIRNVAKILEEAEQRAKEAQREAERRAREAEAQRRAQASASQKSSGGGGGRGF